jgi:hypothetical protein
MVRIAPVANDLRIESRKQKSGLSNVQLLLRDPGELGHVVRHNSANVW